MIIIGSGNIVHSLRLMNMQGDTTEWAKDFDQYITALEAGDDDALIHIERCAQMNITCHLYMLRLYARPMTTCIF
ncbi:MAG: hypothetical protein H0W85_05125 [Methylotenera sp.]|nr:hypothetical protein [Methylotenera sp.]